MAPAQNAVREMRKFAWTTSVGFTLLFCVLPLAFKKNFHAWPLVLSAVLVTMAFTVPLALKPVYKFWMAAGHALGWVNSKIILSAVFFLIFFPIAALRRALGKGTILTKLKADPTLKTYRVPSEASPRERMEKPY